MKKSYIAMIICACLAPSALAQEEVAFSKPYWTQQPVIEALGRAEVEVAPNRASFSVEFVETDKNADDAMASVVERARIAYDAIKAVADKDKTRVSTSVGVDPYYEQYRDKDGDYYENDRPDKVKGYEAKASLSVEILDIAEAGRVRAAALALGPEESGAMYTYLQRTAENDRLAYEAAVADGSARAKASAEAAGAKLGKLLVVQEGQGPCLGGWSSSGGRSYDYYKSAPVPMTEAYAEDSVVVTARKRDGGEITITEADIEALNLPSDEKPETVSARVCMVYAIEG